MPAGTFLAGVGNDHVQPAPEAVLFAGLFVAGLLLAVLFATCWPREHDA